MSANPKTDDPISYTYHQTSLEIAYYSLLSVHAALLLDVADGEDIRYQLDIAYPFSLPESAIADLRAQLNAEREDRARMARRQFKTTTGTQS
jgi:hypothetical protein